MDACQPRGVTHACNPDVNELNGLAEIMFAREKQLPLLECDVEDMDQEEDTFSAIVEKIMEAWDGKAMIGEI